MGNFKTFGELKEGDSFFSINIKNSTIEQNCVGNIFDKFIVKEVTNVDDRVVSLKAIYDKSTFIEGWLPTGNEEVISVLINKNAQDRIINTEPAQNKINCTIYSTNVETLIETTEICIKTLETKYEEIKKVKNEIEHDLLNIKMNFCTRKLFGAKYDKVNSKEFQEVVKTEEVYV